MSDTLFDADLYARMTPGQKAAYTKRIRGGKPRTARKASLVQPGWEREIEQLAEAKLRQHGLWDQGWRMQWDTATKRAGCCHYSTKLITMSRAIFAIEKNRSEVENTILHEIAHALVGAAHGHDIKWKVVAKQIGCNGKRCHAMETPASKRPVWKADCSCGATHTKTRLTPGAQYRCRRTGQVLSWYREVSR